MKRSTIALASFAVVVVIVVAAIVYQHVAPNRQLQSASVAPTSAPLAVGQTAPTFTLPTTAGVFDLQKTQKPVFIEVFATWCPHCQRETVVLNRLFGAYGAHVAFLAIPGSTTAMDGQDSETQLDVLAFETRFAVKYPIGAYDPNLTVANTYLQGGFPTIAIVAKNKKIAYLNSGEIPYADLAKQLDAVLK